MVSLRYVSGVNYWREVNAMYSEPITMCVVMWDYQLWLSKTVRRYSSHIWVSVYIIISKQMHKHTCLRKTHTIRLSHSLTLYLALCVMQTHTHTWTLVCFVSFSLTNLPPTHIMYTELNSAALYAFTQGDSFSDCRMSRIPAFQTVACRFMTDRISHTFQDTFYQLKKKKFHVTAVASQTGRDYTYVTIYSVWSFYYYFIGDKGTFPLSKTKWSAVWVQS